MGLNYPFSPDWAGTKDPWIGVSVDLVALQTVVCQIFRLPMTQCGPPVHLNPIEEHEEESYARVYSFQLPSRTVVAHLTAPVKPLFKTESEVAAMDFVCSRTSLPIPTVFTYCSEADNPVGVEWLIMEHVPGVMMSDAFEGLQFPQKQRLALDLVDLHDQLYRLKTDGCGGIYHNVNSVDDCGFVSNLNSGSSEVKLRRALRWKPLSAESLHMLRCLCSHSVGNDYQLGPSNDISLLQYMVTVPSPLQMMPTFTSEDYIKLLAFNGNPTTRSENDFPSREKCVELFHSIHNLYPNSALLGPPGDSSNFRFSHGDLHGGNILVNPQSGAITGIIDWEAAAFRPLWAGVKCGTWFSEDDQRFIFGDEEPENFEHDAGPGDAALRAFFRTNLFKRNPDLFTCFFGGIELCSIQNAACNDPRPIGLVEIYLDHYHSMGYWNEGHRGNFPWDMNAWFGRRWDLDELNRERVEALNASKAAVICPSSI